MWNFQCMYIVLKIFLATFGQIRPFPATNFSQPTTIFETCKELFDRKLKTGCRRFRIENSTFRGDFFNILTTFLGAW
jgi:hypothetical protein